MTKNNPIHILSTARWYDLTQALSIFTPPWPGEMPLQVHFFKRLTGSFGGGQGANGQLIEWSNNTGTHLVGPRAFHSGSTAISDIPLDALHGEGVVVDISDAVSDYSLYTPEMIMERADVKEGDILFINTGYHKHGWDQPDEYNDDAQGGVNNKEFGYYLRHPGPSPDFFAWAMGLKLKMIGVDCGSAEHPMNTNLRTMHAREFEKAEAKLIAEYGKTWDEMFPPEEYHALTHIDMPKAGLLLAESLGGQIGELANTRGWLMVNPIPFMEVESAWSRVTAVLPPHRHDRSRLLRLHVQPRHLRHDVAIQRANAAMGQLCAAERQLHQAGRRPILRAGTQQRPLPRQFPSCQPHGRRKTFPCRRAHHRRNAV